MDLLEERLKETLEHRGRRVIPEAGLRRAAVLVPILHKDGEHHLLFTKRTEIVRYHKGQISFPGGGYDAQDGTLLNAALRESMEEIGLAPADVEVLGALDDEPTWVSGYIITPFVGVIPSPYPFRISQHEIDEVLEVPLGLLLDCRNVRVENEERGGQIVQGYRYHCLGRVIWGATARILNSFLGILAELIKEERREQQ